MTTVVWDGKELVSDSQITSMDTAELAPFRKIHTPEEDEYWEVKGVKVLAFGLAGDAMAIDYIREKLNAGINFRTKFDDAHDLVFRAVLINEKGEAFLWTVIKNKERNRERNELLPMLPPIAIGSGREFALGVMATPKGDARAAVKAAIRLDVGSGGNLQYFLFPGVPDTLSVRPPKPVEETPVTPPASTEEAAKDADVKPDEKPAQAA